MKTNVTLVTVLLLGCSSSNEDAGPQSSVTLTTCASDTYSFKQSEFFGNNSYRIIPTPSITEVLVVCETLTSQEASVVKPICDWANRKKPSDENDIGIASDEAYWAIEPVELMVPKLNNCS